jgi:hypothetical protein
MEALIDDAEAALSDELVDTKLAAEDLPDKAERVNRHRFGRYHDGRRDLEIPVTC